MIEKIIPKEEFESKKYKTVIDANGKTIMPGMIDCHLHTAMFNPEAEAGLNAIDSRLGINWPAAISQRSDRDMNHTMLTPQFPGVVL